MKKIMMAVALASFGFVGCADVCAKQAECAKKSGDTFSQTECSNDAKIEQEKADNKGCGSQYSAALACISSLDCAQIRDGNAITAECGAKLDQYNKCVQ